MEKFKNTLAGVGMVGLGSDMGSLSFDWSNWVTTVLLWVLMLVAIFAIAKYISKK